jgi:hypothetical protein
MRTVLASAVLMATITSTSSNFPGDPPSLTKATGAVGLVDGKDVRTLDVFLSGTDTWTLSATAGDDVKLTITLPKLAIGKFKGTDATLVMGERTLHGNWIVEITRASPGYLKSPGPCSGRLAVTFSKDTYVSGRFEDAGCISYNPKP